MAWGRQKVRARQVTARVLTASGKRIDPASTADLKELKDNRDPSEVECWRWNRVIGEVKFGGRFMRNACARVSLPIAVIPDQDADPVVLTTAMEQGLVAGVPVEEAMFPKPVVSLATAELAVEAMAEMFDGQDREGALLGGWGAKSFLIGDGYLIGYTTPRETLPYAEPISEPGELPTRQRWVFVAPHVLVENSSPKDGQGKFALKGAYSTSGGTVPLPADAFILRIWREHEEWPDMADSLVRGVLLECEELYITQRSLKAIATSKLSAPILVVANELSAGADDPTNDDSENPTDDPFTAAYVEHTTTPTVDTGSAASIANLLVRGPLDPGGDGKHSLRDAIFTVDATRPIDASVLERCSYLVGRIRAGLEFPTELYDGLGSVNHWGAWELNDNIYREFVQPTVREFADQVTTKYLRPRLEASGVSPEEAAHITLIDDASRLVARPNRGSNVRDAHGALVISDASAREAWGFDDGDAPSDEEVERRTVVNRGGVTPEMLAAWFNQTTANPPLPMAPAPLELPPVPAEDTSGGQDTIPSETIVAGVSLLQRLVPDEIEPATITAASRRRTGGQRLAAIDARLLDRITRLADQTVTRMVAQAGQRVLSTLAGDQRGDAQRIAARTLLRHVKDKARIPATLGASKLAELNIDAERLLEDEMEDAHAAWEEEVKAAQKAGNRIAVSALQLEEPGLEALDRKQEDRRNAAWPIFAAAVLVAARDALFAPPPIPGEPGSPGVPRVQPGVVREALAKAGGSSATTNPTTGAVTDPSTGGPVGLVATGDDMAELWGLHGQPWTGYVWTHDDPPTDFPDHLALDGVEFDTWESPELSTLGSDSEWVGPYWFPGDHIGCSCVVAPTYPE